MLPSLIGQIFDSPSDRRLGVSSIAAQADQTSEINTVFSDLTDQLPTTVNVTLTNASVLAMAVTWVIGTYDKDTVGTYAIKGNLTVPTTVKPTSIQATINVTTFWSPNAATDKARSIYWGCVWNRALMYKEAYGTDVPRTKVGVVTDTVGLVQERSAGAPITTSADAGRPVLNTDGGTGIPLLKFDGASNSMAIRGSSTLLSTLVAASPFWFYREKRKKNEDGRTQVLWSSDTGTGTKTGIYLDVDNTNKLNIILTQAGTTIVFHTSAFTFTVADGLCDIMFDITGTSCRLMITKSGVTTTESFSTTGTGAGGNHFSDLALCARDTDGNNKFNGWIGDFEFGTGILSAQDITNWKNYVPPLKNVRIAPIVYATFDFTASASNFSDASGTIPCGNGDQIRVSKNTRASIAGAFNRDATGGAGASPIFTTGQVNSKSAAVFNGVDQLLTLQQTTQKGGCTSWLLVYKNTDATVGSLLMDNFYAIAEYNSNAAYRFGACFDVVLSLVGTRRLSSSQVNRNNQWNAHLVTRIGSTLYITNCNKETDTALYDTITLSGSYTDDMVNTVIGKTALGITKGGIAEIRQYVGCEFNTAGITALMDSIVSTYALAPTAPAANGVGKVYLFAGGGQSNDNGDNQASTGHEPYGTMPSYLQANMANIRMFNNSGFTASFTADSNRLWGYRNQLMYRMNSYLGRNSYWVNYATPSAALGPDGSPIYDQAAALATFTLAYNTLVTRYGASNVEVVFLPWNLGQTDSGFANNAIAYAGGSLATWFAALRTALGATMKILYVKLPDWDAGSQAASIRTTQTSINTAPNYMIVADGTSHKVDNQHWDATGCLQLGDLTYSAVLPLVA